MDFQTQKLLLGRKVEDGLGSYSFHLGFWNAGICLQTPSCFVLGLPISFITLGQSGFRLRFRWLRTMYSLGASRTDNGTCTKQQVERNGNFALSCTNCKARRADCDAQQEMMRMSSAQTTSRRYESW